MTLQYSTSTNVILDYFSTLLQLTSMTLSLVLLHLQIIDTGKEPQAMTTSESRSHQNSIQTKPQKYIAGQCKPIESRIAQE